MQARRTDGESTKVASNVGASWLRVDCLAPRLLGGWLRASSFRLDLSLCRRRPLRPGSHAPCPSYPAESALLAMNPRYSVDEVGREGTKWDAPLKTATTLGLLQTRRRRWDGMGSEIETQTASSAQLVVCRRRRLVRLTPSRKAARLDDAVAEAMVWQPTVARSCCVPLLLRALEASNDQQTALLRLHRHGWSGLKWTHDRHRT